MIWDTLGEEEFKSIAAIFFRKAVGAFLIYDVNDRKSFEELDSWFD
jgi:GTPase SAR1 family protein